MTGDEVYLRHIIEAIDLIARYVAVGEKRFRITTYLQDAVVRRSEIVGEATKRLSPETRARFPLIDWRGASGMRDILIHNDMGVDLTRVWQPATQRAPLLRPRIEAVLEGSADSAS